MINAYFVLICHVIAYVAGDSNKTEFSLNGSNFYKPEQDKKPTGQWRSQRNTPLHTHTDHASSHQARKDFKIQIRYSRSNKSLWVENLSAQYFNFKMTYSLMLVL